MTEKEEVEVEEEEIDESLQAMLKDLSSKKKKKKSKKKSASKPSQDGDGDDDGEGDDGDDGDKSTMVSAQQPIGDYSYQFMLDRIYAQLRANNPDLVNKKRAVLRPPEVMRVGTNKILWANFPEICKMMKRDPDHVFKFFLAELGTTGSIDGNGRFMIKGKFIPKYIESLLKKYIGEYVTCHMCRQVETKLVRDPVSRMYFIHCSSCGASRAVSSIQKGYHATGRGERRAARNAA